MQLKIWAVTAFVSLGLWTGGGSAIAQTLEPTPTSDDAETLDTLDLPEAAIAPDVPLETYTLEGSFALQVPTDWVAEGHAEERHAVVTNYPADRVATTEPQATDIKTEIFVVDEPPDTFVQAELAKMIQAAYPVQRYVPVKVNDRTAIRLWVVGLPDGYSRQMITFVGYASYGTAMIVTSYNSNTPATEALIEQVHNSFELRF